MDLYPVSSRRACRFGHAAWTRADNIAGIVPAEIFDTKTRSMGVAIATMTSFAFNTMIGQVTPIAIEKLGYRFYILFVSLRVYCGYSPR